MRRFPAVCPCPLPTGPGPGRKSEESLSLDTSDRFQDSAASFSEGAPGARFQVALL